jgi:hypothetical protein
LKSGSNDDKEDQKICRHQKGAHLASGQEAGSTLEGSFTISKNRFEIRYSSDSLAGSLRVCPEKGLATLRRNTNG